MQFNLWFKCKQRQCSITQFHKLSPTEIDPLFQRLCFSDSRNEKWSKLSIIWFCSLWQVCQLFQLLFEFWSSQSARSLFYMQSFCSVFILPKKLKYLWVLWSCKCLLCWLRMVMIMQGNLCILSWNEYCV